MLPSIALWLALHLPYVFFQVICFQQLRGFARLASFLPLPFVLLPTVSLLWFAVPRPNASFGLTDLVVGGMMTMLILFVATVYCLIFQLVADFIQRRQQNRQDANDTTEL